MLLPEEEIKNPSVVCADSSVGRFLSVESSWCNRRSGLLIVCASNLPSFVLAGGQEEKSMRIFGPLCQYRVALFSVT